MREDKKAAYDAMLQTENNWEHPQNRFSFFCTSSWAWLEMPTVPCPFSTAMYSCDLVYHLPGAENKLSITDWPRAQNFRKFSL